MFLEISSSKSRVQTQAKKKANNNNNNHHHHHHHVNNNNNNDDDDDDNNTLRTNSAPVYTLSWKIPYKSV